MEGIFNDISINLQNGEDEEVANLVAKALEAGHAPKSILDEGLIAGMDIIGEKFGRHEIFLPDVLLSAKAMTAGLEILKPFLSCSDERTAGKVVIGTVKGDLHDIGKNLVAVMLRGAGFEVIDLGKDVSADRFVDTALESGASVIGLSALLTTTMPEMKTVIDIIRSKGVTDKISVIIGGAPVSEDFAREIGADGYAHDAAQSVKCVKSLFGVAK